MKEICFHPNHITSLKRPRLPASMLIPALVVITILAALVISSVANVEVITTASGRIIPSGKVKVIKASESGVVSKLLVTDGQKVNAGDPLFEIDDRSIRSELRRISTELASVTSKYSLIEPIMGLNFKPFKGFSIEHMRAWVSKIEGTSELDRVWLVKRLASVQDVVLQVDREIKELRVQRRIVSSEADKLKRIEPIAEKNYQSQRRLAGKGYTSKVALGQQEIDYLETSFNLRKNWLDIELIDVKVASLQKRGAEIFRQFQVDITSELQTLQQRKEELSERRVGLLASLDNTKIVSPISGVVEAVKLTSSGIYVGTGDELMSIVPANDTPIAEIAIPSREIGFLRSGQKARIKIDAFPFTRYGSVSAKLIYLSRDAMTSEDGSNLMYTGHLQLEDTSFSVKGEKQPIQIGMSLKGEVITNERRLIDFFISPIKETLSEALRER